MGDNHKKAHEEVQEWVKSLRDLEEDLAEALDDLKITFSACARDKCTRTTTPGDDASDSDDYQEWHHPQPSCHPCRTQLIVNGSLTLPPEKPDMEAILRFIPACKVTNWQCVHTEDGRKIVVTGLVTVNVEYVANLPEQPMHFAHFVVPFHTFFLCSKPIKDVLCDVEFKHQELLDARTISKVVLLAVRGVE